MTRLEVLNPMAQQATVTAIAPAPRLPDLSGKRIGLYWNMKAGGEEALQHVGEVLRRRYPDLSTELYIGSIGSLFRHVTAEDADRIAPKVDAVVGATAD